MFKEYRAAAAQAVREGVSQCTKFSTRANSRTADEIGSLKLTGFIKSTGSVFADYLQDIYPQINDEGVWIVDG
jgi:hypothetical protein